MSLWFLQFLVFWLSHCLCFCHLCTRVLALLGAYFSRFRMFSVHFACACSVFVCLHFSSWCACLGFLRGYLAFPSFSVSYFLDYATCVCLPCCFCVFIYFVFVYLVRGARVYGLVFSLQCSIIFARLVRIWRYFCADVCSNVCMHSSAGVLAVSIAIWSVV